MYAIGQSVVYRGTHAVVCDVQVNAVVILRESGAQFTVMQDDSELESEPESSVRP